MSIKKPKQPADVLGNLERCPKFIQCPLCYGCRSYDSSDLDCIKCTTNKKFNVCNTELHKNDIVARFITKTQYSINGDIEIKSYNKDKEEK